MRTGGIRRLRSIQRSQYLLSSKNTESSLTQREKSTSSVASACSRAHMKSANTCGSASDLWKAKQTWSESSCF
jgi:hypothetical protein